MAKNFSIVADIQLRGPKNIRGLATSIRRGLSGIKAKVDVDISRGVTARLNGLNTTLQKVNTSLRAIRTNARSATTQLQNLAAALQNLSTIQSKFNFNSKFTNSLSRGVKKAKSEITEFGEQSALAVRRFAAFAAPTAVMFGLISAIKEGVSSAISFEKEMTRLSQVTGRSVDNLSGLSNEITRLSTGLGVSSDELGNIATTLAQAGLTARDTTKALEALARSGLSASFGDIKNTTEGVIAIMAQFGVSADQLQGKLGSINAVSAQFAVESEDLVSAVRRTGGAFKASGGNLEELLSLFTSVRATTRESADSIATGFRTIFTRIQRPRTIQYLKELGVNLADLEGKFIGPYESVRRLSAALKDVEGTDPRFAAIVEELGGFRQVSKVIPLIQQFDLAQKALNTSQSGAISIVEDSEIAQKSLANQIVKVREEFLALFRELTADDSFKATVKLVLDMSRGIIDLTRALKPLIPLMAALAATQAATTSGQFLSGFTSGLSKHGSGGKRRFASGGIVPGSGRGDKTHLMAEPGEFVVRRDAVDKLGRGTLASLNSNPQKFAKGDFVKALSGFVGPLRQNVSKLSKGDSKAEIQATIARDLEAAGMSDTDEGVSLNKIQRLAKGFKARGDSGEIDSFISSAKNIVPKTSRGEQKLETVLKRSRVNSGINGEFRIGETPRFGILAPQATSLADITKSTTVRSLQPNAIKNISRLSGLDPKSILNSTATGTMGVATLNPALKTNFDRASGAGIHNLLGTVLDAANVEPALKNLGMSRNGTIDRIAQKIDVAPIHGKIFEGFIAALTQQFSGHPQASFDFKPDKSFDTIFNNASRFTFGDAKGSINSKTALNMLGKAFTSANSFNALSPDFLSIFLNGGSKQIAKKAAGGKIRNNEVPIIAEPGEFIINKNSAQKLGPKKLRSLNNADRMHAGGFVGKKFARGGQVSSGLSQSGQGAFVIGALSSVASSFSNLEGTTGKLVAQFTTLSFAVGGVKTVLDGFVNNDRARTLGLFGSSGAARSAGLTVGNAKLDKAIGFAARNVDKLNLGVAVASSALLLWGQSLESDAQALAAHAQTQEELGRATSKNSFASGLKGAGAGAGIGAALGSVLPGVGTALGAVVGASIGTLAGVMTANNEKLIQTFKQGQFDKVSETLDTLASDFAAGRINAQSNAIGTANAARSQLSSIRGAGTAENRASFTKQLRGDESKIRTAISSIEETVSTIDDFEKAFGNSGATLIETIQVLTHKTYPQVRKEIENEIKVRVESKKASESINKSLGAFDVMTVKLHAFSSAIEDASDSLNTLTPMFETIVANISGDLASGKSGSSAIGSGIFGRASKGGIADDSVLRSAAGQLVGGLKSGSSGSGIVEDIANLSQLTRELPGILERSAAKTGLGATNDQAALAFQAEFDNTLSVFDKQLGTIVKNIFSAELSSREGGGDAGFIKATREQLGELTKKLIPDSLQGTGDALDAAAKSIVEQTSVISDRLAQQVKIELDLAKQRTDIEEKKLEVEQSALKDGKTLSLDRVKSAFSSQQNALLKGTGAGRSVDAIADQLTKVLKEREAVTSKLSGVKPGEEAAAAQTKLAGLNSEAGKLRAALENLAKSTLVVSKVQDELAKQEQDRASSKGLVKDLILGGGSGRVDFAKSFSAINGIVKSGGSLTDLPEELRKSTLELLDKLPQNRKTSFLGDRTPEEFINASLAKDLAKRAKLEGASPEVADELFKLISSGTTEETDLRKQLVDLQTQSLTAQQRIADVSEAGFASLITSNETALKEFATKTNEAIFSVGIGETKAKLSSLGNSRLTAETERGGLERLAKFGGVGVSSAVERGNKLRGFGTQFNNIIAATSSLESIKALKTANTGDAAQLLHGSLPINNLGVKSLNQSDVDKAIDKFVSQQVVSRNLTDGGEGLRKSIKKEFGKEAFLPTRNVPVGSFSRGQSGIPFGAVGVAAQARGVENFTRFNPDDTQTQFDLLNAIFQRGFEKFVSEQESVIQKTIGENRAKIEGQGIGSDIVDKIVSSGGLKELDSLMNNLSDATLKAKDPLKAIVDEIERISAQEVIVKGQKSDLEAQKASLKAFGGSIRGRGISSPMVSFAPQGTDRIPAMLSRGEFVVKKSAAQANLPLLNTINATGFADGGPVGARQVELARRRDERKAGKAALRANFAATHSVAKTAVLSPEARAAKIAKSDALISAAKRNKEDAFIEGISVKQLLENRRKVERDALTSRIKTISDKRESDARAKISREKLKEEDAFLFGTPSVSDPSKERKDRLESRRKARDFSRSEKEFSGLSPASSKIPTPSRLLKAVGFKGILKKALGGSVPGIGTGDTVPSLLTPGEFVLNKRASASIGLNQLNRFNAGGIAGGKGITDRQSGNLNSGPLTQSLTAFTQSASQLAGSMSAWTETASKLAEAIAGFPHEVTVQHSQIPVIVNVGGMQGLQENVQALVMAEVDKRMGLQAAKSADGKKPFMAGAA